MYGVLGNQSRTPVLLNMCYRKEIYYGKRKNMWDIPIKE